MFLKIIASYKGDFSDLLKAVERSLENYRVKAYGHSILVYSSPVTPIEALLKFKENGSLEIYADKMEFLDILLRIDGIKLSDIDAF